MKGVVTGVEAKVDLLVLQAGKTFPFDSAELTQQGKQQLAAAAAAHKDVYIQRVNVTGYTDKIGNDETTWRCPNNVPMRSSQSLSPMVYRRSVSGLSRAVRMIRW
jgi:outer membrane protein OmpA-like peptidoglycan-associated protein